MKYLAWLLMLASSLAHADDWTGQDKRIHFAVSATLGVATANQWPTRPALAFGVAMVPGFLKEVADSRPGGSGFSYKDLTADALGAALGVLGTQWMISKVGSSTMVSYRTEF